VLLLRDYNKTALIAGDQSISYKEFLRTTWAWALALKDLTFTKAVIFAENSCDWAYAHYAIWQNGGISIPVDHLSPTDDLAYILKDCQPELIFCSEETQATAQTAIKAANSSATIIVLNNFEASKTDHDFESVNWNRNDQDTAIIMYTSGTTGSPKGVMLSFGNLVVNCDAIENAKIFTTSQRILMMLPLHHILPLLGTLIGPLYCGSTIILSPSLSPTDIMAALQQHKATAIIGVPRFYSLITKNIRAKIEASAIARTLYAIANKLKSKRFSRIVFKQVHAKFGGDMHYMVSGGAPLDPAVSQCLETLGFSVLEGYGMTETAPMISFPRPEKYKLGACGQALDSNEIRIQDGEVITRGPNIMQGYYNRPEETADVLKDGWLYTGDLGYLDDEGFLFITGRKKEIIVLPSGKNINPQRIEEKLAAVASGVQEVGVYMADNILQALIVLDPEVRAQHDPDKLNEFVRTEILRQYNDSVAPYKRIARFQLSEDGLPRTRMGKVRRFKLAEIARMKNPSVERAPDPDTSTYKKMAGFLATLVSVPIFADARLDSDLAIDSLGLISLQVFVSESYGIELTDEILKAHPTLRSLVEYIHSTKTKDESGGVDWRKILQSPGNLKLPRSGWIHSVVILLSKIFVRLP